MGTLPSVSRTVNGSTGWLLGLVWGNRMRRFVVPVALAASFAGLSAWLTPRGPITPFEALLTMAAALFVGAACGVVTGRRWSMLLVPAVYIGVFELARLDVAGPTVDAIHLTSLYGLIAFAVGRLVHGVLVLAPMLLGTVYGVELAARLGPGVAAPLGIVGWTLTGLLSLAVLGVAVSVARPATTYSIVGPDGDPLPGSIAELITVPIGGHEQALMVRGRSTDNPVLLYLAGGPGGTDLGAMRRDVALEERFVVVTWEQRGAGKSYAALDPAETLTLEQTVADTVAVTTYLRERFDEEKIYLVGNSWGTTLGVLAVQRHPELFHAYVGTGQMVSQRETDILFYADTLAWADHAGNDALATRLRQIGPPPYTSLLDYEPALSHEHDWNVYPEFELTQ